MGFGLLNAGFFQFGLNFRKSYLHWMDLGFYIFGWPHFDLDFDLHPFPSQITALKVLFTSANCTVN